MRPRIVAVLILAGVAPLAACQQKPAEAQYVNADAATAVNSAASVSISRSDGVRALALQSQDPRAAAAAIAPPNTLGGPANAGPSPTLDTQVRPAAGN